MQAITIRFTALPTTLEQLQAIPEAALSTPYAAAALTVAALCNYDADPEETIRMLNYLKGPQPLSPYETQFLRDRLKGKPYKMRSFFAGTSPANNYTPTEPYEITVYDDLYSYSETNFAKLNIRSSGADSPRQIKLRKKGEQWFLWENYLMSDIRIPAEEDPWA